MMKIWALIKKDILLCPGWLVGGLLLAFLAPAYFLYISDMSRLFVEPVFLLSALFACNIAVSRICYIEDNHETKKLLNAMPVYNYQFVISRYIESICLIIALIAFALGNALIQNVTIHWEWVIVFVFGGLAYEGIYLFFFYRCGTNIAQYALVGIIGMMGAAYFIGQKLGVSLGHIYITEGASVACLCAAVGIYVLSAVLSCRYYKSS